MIQHRHIIIEINSQIIETGCAQTLGGYRVETVETGCTQTLGGYKVKREEIGCTQTLGGYRVETWETGCTQTLTQILRNHHRQGPKLERKHLRSTNKSMEKNLLLAEAERIWSEQDHTQAILRINRTIGNVV